MRIFSLARREAQQCRGLCKGLAVLAVALAPLGAAAETSSWQQRVAPAPKAKPAQGSTSSKVQSQTVQPGQSPKQRLAPLGNLPSARSGASLGPAVTSSPDAGTWSSDPAYEAFDQGRYLTALSLAARQVSAGDPQAHTLIARIHAEGLGVPQDVNLAALWYQRAMELGDLEAALALGTLYARGSGVKQDYTKAAGLYEKAAIKGHPEARYNLALLFLAGLGKPENPVRAYHLMRHAAENGVTAAMYDLGTLYATGTGTEPNAFEAARWIGKAANAGHTEAEIEYAVILLKNHELPEDEKGKMRRRAVELLRSAATKGMTAAQNRLAHCYLQGLGAPKDLVEAAKWHLVAKAGGQEDAGLDKIVASLSRADRAKAQMAASEWREQTFLE